MACVYEFDCGHYLYTCENCHHEQKVCADDVLREHDDSSLEECAISDMLGTVVGERSHRVYKIKFNVSFPCNNCNKDIMVGVRAVAHPDWGPITYEEVKLCEPPSIEGFQDITDLEVLDGITSAAVCSDSDTDDDDYYDDASDYYEPDYEDEFEYLSELEEPRSVEQEKWSDLTIIVKSAMNGGYCHLGFDAPSGKIFRPIYRKQEGLCCWDRPLEVGKAYSFRILSSPGDSSPPVTPLPHCNEDLYIKFECTRPPPSEPTQANNLFCQLRRVAKPSVEDIFGSHLIQEYKYVVEGTDCPSAGVLKCTGNDLMYFRNSDNKRRIRFGQYDFPITVSWSDHCLTNLPDRPTLLVLGLGRPFGGSINPETGNHYFSPKRCYIIVVGIFQSQ